MSTFSEHVFELVSVFRPNCLGGALLRRELNENDEIRHCRSNHRKHESVIEIEHSVGGE